MSDFIFLFFWEKLGLSLLGALKSFRLNLGMR